MADGEQDHPASDPERSRVKRVLKVLLLIPLGLLGLLYALSLAVGTAFGNVVFVLTGVWTVAWILTTGSRGRSMRTAGTSRFGAFLGLDEEYAEKMSRGTLQEYRDPGILLTILTAAVVLGWVIILVEWLL